MLKNTKKISLIAIALMVAILFTNQAYAYEETERNNTTIIRDVKTGDISVIEDDSVISTEFEEKEQLEVGKKNEILPTTIVGSDDRNVVLTVKANPYNCIAHIVATFPNSTIERHGTAVIYGDKLALTAAHCVYEPEYGGWATEVRVEVGRLQGLTMYGTVYAERYIAKNGFIENGLVDYDYAVLELSGMPADDNGNTCGIANLYVSAASIGANIMTAGYPCKTNREGIMYESTGQILDKSLTRIYHNADTEKGQSGSPVFDSNNNVIGIEHGCLNDDIYQRNLAVRITSYILDFCNSFK